MIATNTPSICVLGAGGLIGQSIIFYFCGKGYNVTPVTHKGDIGLFKTEVGLDITHKESVEEYFSKNQSDIILNASGISGFQRCEDNSDLAHAVNVQGVENILNSLSTKNTLFIQLSSNAVFGKGDGNYKENEKYSPTALYGVTRMKAELAVQQNSSNHLIVRTCDVFGSYMYTHRENRFIHYLLKKMSANEYVEVYSDIISTPTYSHDLCRGIEFLIQKRCTGTFHIAGSHALNRLEYAFYVADIFNHDKQLIQPAEMTQILYNSYSSLNIDKIKDMGFIPKLLSEGLQHFKDNMPHGKIFTSKGNL